MFMGPTWGPPGADRTQGGPMWAPWTLLSGYVDGLAKDCGYHSCAHRHRYVRVESAKIAST